MKMRKFLAAFCTAAMICTTVPSFAFAAQISDSGASAEEEPPVPTAEPVDGWDENVLPATAKPVYEYTEPVPTAEPEAAAYAEEETEDTEAELAASTTYPYQDTSLSFEERAADLVARMTLEEKAAQTAAKSAPAISRLGVQAYYYWCEGIHGVARQGVATSFPSSLSMSNTWNRDLMYEIMDITSTEARAKNPNKNLNYWNPTINMARDPRWGRNEESYGEDPYLTSEIGSSAVEGMQGRDSKYLKTISTLKHYAANNCEGERQTGTSVLNERTLREYYTRAFRDIIESSDPGAVMSSYNGTTIYRNGELVTASDGQKVDYIASSANTYLLTDVLRRTYGFGGFVVGDCGAWDNAYGRQPLRQKLYPDTALDNITATMTVSKIVNAGSSLDCNSGANGTGQVLAAVEEGLISEDTLDVMVYELFLARMKTGEFDSKSDVEYQNITSSEIETDEHVAKAEEAAEETWVLLENDGTLPLKGEETTDTDDPYTITDAVFTDDNTLSVTYEKQSDAPAGAKIFAANYSDADASVMTECVDVDVDGSGSQTIAVSKPASGITKVFVWENTDSIKPLSQTKTVGESSGGPINVAVVGNLAADAYLGDYSGEPTKTTTNIDGITAAVKAQNSESTVNLIGNVDDKTPLFNIKSITLVKSTGKNATLDLSKATKVNGMTVSDGTFTDITKSGVACIPSVDFKDVTDIEIEAASLPGMPNVNVGIYYGSLSQQAGTVSIKTTSSSDTYETNTGVYEGATGGYNSTADLYIQVNASADFSVENYKDSLDKADYIIAYGGTTKDDSGESNDRSSIDLPSHQSHVQQLCDAYPEKTIVVLSTVGQVNVEPFKDKCAALLWTSYNGQTQGEALGKVLTGEVNPSGKLSTTWYTSADLDKMPIGSSKTTVDGISYNYTNYELSENINDTSAEWPGRTYQYYTGTPVYAFGYGSSYTTFEYSNITIDKTSADANDTVTITADITNTGSVTGKEVAQLYITVPGADGKTLPLKQLKGFEKIELQPGETKTVSFALDISDVFFYNESEQQNYVIDGEYTAVVGSSSDDANALSVKFNVSGDIADTIKSVYTIPSGLRVYGAKDSAGNVSPAGGVSAGASVTLKNDKVVTDFAANGISVTYKSADETVATVDADGTVKAGGTEGVTTITVTAEKNGSTASATFPIVSQFKDKIEDSVKAAYLKTLDDTYGSCPEIAYTAENYAKITSIYNTAYSTVSEALLDDGLALTVSNAVEEMLAVPKYELEEAYTVESVNKNIIKDNRIEYSADGIGEPTVTDTTISGTITESSPATIEMEALSNGTKLSGDLIWTIERVDGSGRQDPSIDMNSGTITLYENGIYKITASDYTNKKCGSITVYADLQIEGESADDSGGADLTDTKSGASGGLDAGSTSSYWLRFDGVKLSRLTDITFRVSQKDADSTINVSLLPNEDWIIATATAPQTGSWTTWTTVKADVNRSDLNRLTLDENGCGTIYIQTNKANLDYIMLGYNNEAVDAYCLPNGRIAVNTNASGGTVTATVGGVEKATAEIETNGSAVLSGFTEGDEVTITDPSGNMASLTYKAAAPKSLLVYNFSDSVFDSLFDSAEGTYHSSGLGMDGYGGWNTTTKSVSYKYGDRTYKFTRALKGGKAGDTARKMFFTPDADGAVTVFFNASTDRCMNIEQDGKVTTQYGTGSISIMQMNVTAGTPVYVYGGGSNKDLYGVIFEADKTITEATPTPSPTPRPTEEPLPDTDYTKTIEFEDCLTTSWTTGADITSTSKASGGKAIENTKDGDIVYLGEVDADNLLVADVVAATRDSAGTCTVTLYAADMTGIDVSTATKSTIQALLTSDNSLGSKEILSNPSKWDDYNDHNIVLSKTLTGKVGIFAKLNSTGKYCGNYDKIDLKYNLSTSSASVSSEDTETEVLTAENANAKISVSGDTVTAVSKYDGTTKTVSYNAEYGKNVTFKKVFTWNDMLTAIAEDNESGETTLLTSPAGTVWIDATPTYFAETNTTIPDTLVINDAVEADGQLYLGCDGGILVTMTSCSKCTVLTKVCDFDIETIEADDDELYLCGGGESMTLALSSARQDDISGEAALTLYNEGRAILVDVRTAEEFAEDSIDGSVNVPIADFAEWLSAQDGSMTVIVYCASGGRAQIAMDIAEELGFTNIYNAKSIDNLR